MLPMNIQQKIFEILHFDSIICNVDRHMRNIELVSNKQVRQIYEHKYVNKAKVSSNTVSEFKDRAYNIEEVLE